MTTHKIHDLNDSFYFITITCYRWIPLFKITHSYDLVYKFFCQLEENDCNVIAYVVMPNHLHFIAYLGNKAPLLNKLIANGKRFIAYDIIKRLKSKNFKNVLNELSENISEKSRAKGQRHYVFKSSFDAMLLDSEFLIEQKLDYIHHNPVSGKWQLTSDYVDYPYSSACFYERDQVPGFPVSHYKSL